MLTSINPGNGKVIKKYKEHSLKEVKTIIKNVGAEFSKWKLTSFSHRAKLMRKASSVLLKNKQKYSRLMIDEMGKPITQSIAEVEKCAWICRHYAENAEKYLENEVVKTEAKKSYVQFDPLGVVLAIMPWNFPFWQVFRFAAPGLMAGNTALLKHASNVPGCALAIEEIFRKAGFPRNAFRTLLIGSGLVSKVIEDNKIVAVTLTGSVNAGSKVAETSGRLIKKTVLELGGSDPFIVLKDANIKKCAVSALNSRNLNAGQSCIAAKRFIVVREIAKEFEQHYTELTRNIIIGNPLDKKVQIGPMAREDLLYALDKQVKGSLKKGAKLLYGGKRLKRKGFFYEPTLLTNVKKGMPAYDEETFGPLASIIKVKNESEAIKVANDSEFGLGASIWTKDLKKAEKLAKKIDAGSVFINTIVGSDPRLPFGGIKKSGYGRELSQYGIKEFVNIKTIKVNNN